MKASIIRRSARTDAQKRKWIETKRFYFCWCCGVHDHDAAWPGLQVAHLVGGAGRSEEPAAWAVLCSHCHRANHGQERPRLTLGALLRLKSLRDPANWNPERLAQLRGCPLPPEEDVPEVLRRGGR